MNSFVLILSLLLSSNSTDIPLGCIEDENPIQLNFPFFTIPVGKKIFYSDDCNIKPSLSQSILNEVAPLNGFKGLKRGDAFIVLEKDRQVIKQFYTTSNLSPYYGIRIIKAKLNTDSKILLTLEKDYGDGLFLLVLRDNERIFARQIIINDVKCAAEAIISVNEFFQIPYRDRNFLETEYQIELYLINYNKMKWKIVGFDIK